MNSLTLVLTLATITPSAQTWTVKCWDAATWDTDKDGYAEYYAPAGQRVDVEVSYADRGTCPIGWVRLRGDCDDNNPNIHPRQSEAAGNGLDDDCDGRADEAEPLYTAAGFGNAIEADGKARFSMVIQVNDARLWKTPNLAHQVEYQPLGHGEPVRGEIRPLTRIRRAGHGWMTRVRVEGVTPGTVYRARVHFLKRRAGSFEPAGAPSDWYYTMSKATNARRAIRTAVVRRAFHEWSLSTQQGVVGYHGTLAPDGTRYSAEMGEPWCSEFYAWVAGHELRDMGEAQTNVSKLRDWFHSRGRYGAFDPTKAQPGDYLPMDTSGDGEPNHSGMFIAWDPVEGTVISLEGNTTGNSLLGDSHASRRGGDEIFMRSRHPKDLHGLGRITP